MREESGSEVRSADWGSLAPTIGQDRDDRRAAVRDIQADLEDGSDRYDHRQLLGKGGMGEVHECMDRRIGREVAMKVVRAGRSGASSTRFLHEARVQARLEHPAIVPVYDLGVERDGGAFFTMKRVRGCTLSDLLAGLAARDEDTCAAYGRRRLLTAFGQVCLAVDFAHSRGVVHRDLKPGNIMLGDFGEVYVLDWGLAKERDPDEPPQSVSRPATKLGQVLGTPGYMAPEQAAGGPVDARTDVYGLGAVLWEILTLQKRDDEPTKCASLRGRARPPTGPRSSIDPPPPELLEVSELAMAEDPARRFPSARALWAEVERYLDGDRDLELRRDRAEAHARAARASVLQALRGGSAQDAHEARRLALRELGQALALDPGHREARRSLFQLLVEPPERMPAEVERELDASARATNRVAGLFGSLAFVYCLLVCPLGYWMGIRDPRITLPWMGAIGVSAALRFATVFWPRQSFRAAVLVLSTAAFTILARLFGPLLVMPGIMAASTVSYSLSPSRWLRGASIVVGAGAILALFGLEQIGVLSPSYTFENGTLVVHSTLSSLPPGPTTALLLLTGLGVVLLPMLFVGQTGRALAKAERRVALHAWHLRQLVPAERDVPCSGACDDRSDGSRS